MNPGLQLGLGHDRMIRRRPWDFKVIETSLCLCVCVYSQSNVQKELV